MEVKFYFHAFSLKIRSASTFKTFLGEQKTRNFTAKTLR